MDVKGKKKKKNQNTDESTHVIPAVKDNTILHSKAQLSLCLFIHISKKHKCNNTKHPESPQQNWSRKGLLILPEAPKINPLLIHPGGKKKKKKVAAKNSTCHSQSSRKSVALTDSCPFLKCRNVQNRGLPTPGTQSIRGVKES